MQMSSFAENIFRQRYSLDGQETWSETAFRVAYNVMRSVGLPFDLICAVQDIITERKFLPGGRYLYAAGRKFHQTQNCILLRAEDSREGWGRHVDHSMRALMTGAGKGGNYSLLREEGASLHSGGGFASGPLSLMQAVNELGRGARQGGSRRGALWAGLSWKHPDIFKFITAKNWPSEVRSLKAKDVNFPAFLDFTNISVCLDDEFFIAYHNESHPKHSLAKDVYWSVVRNMLWSGEPGFSIDVGVNAGEDLRNACTEITSSDDSDICNLGSINLARIGSLAEMRRVTELATLFLLAGTVYSDVPYPKVAEVRSRNRRLGLGLMGLHEWLISRGKPYGPDSDLELYLATYADSESYANTWAKRLSLSEPVKTRAIAPTGTIGIVAETTTGVEPIFCVAYKRRYRVGAEEHRYEYVIDPTAKRLIDQGVNPEVIEDAYSISPERRIAFQSWLQNYVDHGISSTINLPEWGSDNNNPDTIKGFGDNLIKELPNLRGITVYPDGARDGQPLSRVSYDEAVNRQGEVYQVDVCDLKGGSCGS
jgi:ribonucleoside-diphosphate reductase alpha chain